MQEAGLSKRAATSVLLCFGVGCAIGGILGGIVGQILWNWKPGTLPVYAGTSVWLGMPFLFYFINADYTSSSMPLLCAVGFLAGILVSVPGTPFCF